MGSNIKMALILSLTLGLAPFTDNGKFHAHIIKQLKSLFAGTLSEPMDWFDLFLHGAPWIGLLYFSGQLLVKKYKQKK